MSQPQLPTANGSSGGGASSKDNKRPFFASIDPLEMLKKQEEQPVQPSVQPSGLDRKVAELIRNNYDNIGSTISGGPNRVISPEELERREQLCARLRDRMMYPDDQLLTFFGLSKERKPTGRFITEKNTLARNVMRPNQGRIVPTSKKHGDHWFNVRQRPDFTSMQTFETKKTVDEIIDAVELVSDQWEGMGKNELNRVYLPHHGAWEFSTPKCGFKLRIFLAKPVGPEEAGVPVEFTVEVSKIWESSEMNCSLMGSSEARCAFFDLLKGEVTEGHLTEQLRLTALYEEEQKLISEGVEGAKETVERHYAFPFGLSHMHPNFFYKKIEEKSVCEHNA